ncbi:hypothetical protein UFOVP1351_43 [uncultured Caudovirales phage]|uniref:Uncharacterized protein n=1 Tax=uncultured Caudovirales phage TaxID=2100421 RepID=A0A6J5S0T1_9CAUD|nr:hypothetical protein UFOVP1351_43 [uncultured Caudovirales phage]
MSGLPLPKNVFRVGESESYSVRLPNAMREALEELAAQNSVKFGTYVLAVLEDHLQRELKKGTIQPPKSPPTPKR